MSLSIESCRNAELLLLEKQGQCVRNGDMALALVEGERDIGKSQLVHAYVNKMQASHMHYMGVSSKRQCIFIELDLTHNSHYVERILRSIICRLFEAVQYDSVMTERLLGFLEQMELTEIDLYQDKQARTLIDQYERPTPQGCMRREVYINLVKQFLVKAVNVLLDNQRTVIIHLCNAELGHQALFRFFSEWVQQPKHRAAIHVIFTACQYRPSWSVAVSAAPVEAATNDWVPVLCIHLQPLSMAHIREMLEEDFPNRKFCIAGLAQLVLEKTDGNPGKINFFLDLLKEKQLLFLSGIRDNTYWYLDYESKAHSIDLSDYYGESYLFIENSYCYKKIYICAACYERPFSVAMLHELLPKEIKCMIKPAIETGIKYRLLSPLDQKNKEDNDQLYQFNQASIVQNILKLEHQNQLNIVRVRLFERLEAAYPYQQPFGSVRLEQLATIINHVGSVGVNYNDSILRRKIAINLQSGESALDGNDVSTAHRFFSQAVQSLKSKHWHIDYDLSYKCYERYLRSLYLHEAYEESLEALSYCMQRTLLPLHRAKLYARWVNILKSLDRHLEAIEKAFEGLATLGITVKYSPNRIDVIQEYIFSRWQLQNDIRQDSIRSCEESIHEVAVKLLELAALSAYVVNVNLFYYICFRTVRVCSRVGYTPFTCACLVMMAELGRTPFLGRNKIEQFYRYGDPVIQQSKEKSLLRDAVYISCSGTRHMPLNDAIHNILKKLKEHSIYAEPEEISVCYLLYFTLVVFKGDDFSKTLVDLQLAISKLDAPKYTTFNRALRILAQSLSHIVNREKNRGHVLTFAGPYFDESQEPTLEVEHDHLTFITYCSAKLFLSILQGRYQDGIHYGRQCQKYSDGFAVFTLVPVYQFMTIASEFLLLHERQRLGAHPLVLLIRKVYLLPQSIVKLFYFRRFLKHQSEILGHMYWYFKGMFFLIFGGQRIKAVRCMQKGIQMAKFQGYYNVVAMMYDFKDQLLYRYLEKPDRKRRSARTKAYKFYVKSSNWMMSQRIGRLLFEEGESLVESKAVVDQYKIRNRGGKEQGMSKRCTRKSAHKSTHKDTLECVGQ